MSERSIYEVKQVTQVKHSTEEVNEYLREGWLLLLVYSESQDSDNGPNQYPVFVLGYTREEESPSEMQRRIHQEEGRARMEELREMNRERRENNPDSTINE